LNGRAIFEIVNAVSKDYYFKRVPKNIASRKKINF